eukprot:TRINITY_DN60329_c0_g2_i1.p2 TRINITY_DN60329_c0_g2~~TRINITY_DN60329_c0_g2_i1.p2  ORF type:complete len:351 (+),score=45.56 TRINITY_DN60329_c0_g2_i1:57-1055(+)
MYTTDMVSTNKLVNCGLTTTTSTTDGSWCSAATMLLNGDDVSINNIKKQQHSVLSEMSQGGRGFLLPVDRQACTTSSDVSCNMGPTKLSVIINHPTTTTLANITTAASTTATVPPPPQPAAQQQLPPLVPTPLAIILPEIRITPPPSPHCGYIWQAPTLVKQPRRRGQYLKWEGLAKSDRKLEFQTAPSNSGSTLWTKKGCMRNGWHQKGRESGKRRLRPMECMGSWNLGKGDKVAAAGPGRKGEVKRPEATPGAGPRGESESHTIGSPRLLVLQLKCFAVFSNELFHIELCCVNACRPLTIAERLARKRTNQFQCRVKVTLRCINVQKGSC